MAINPQPYGAPGLPYPVETPSIVVGPVDAAWLDHERSARGDEHTARFFEAMHRLAELYGVDLVVSRSKGRWDSRYDPPRLLEATVRFRHPAAPKKVSARREKRYVPRPSNCSGGGR